MARTRDVDRAGVPPIPGVALEGTPLRPARALRVVAVLATSVALAAVLVPGGAAVDIGRPYDLRDGASPVAVITDTNPLSRIATWSAEPQPGRLLFTVDAGEPRNWVLAVLDTFDGQLWRSSAQLRTAGTRVPAPGEPVRRPSPLQQHVVIQDLDGVFLPAAEQPVGVRGQDIDVDAGSGMLVSAHPLRAGMAYAVQSAPAPVLEAAQLAALQPGPDDGTGPAGGAGAVTAVPVGVPPEITALARQATARARSPFQQAAALERYLRSTYRNDPASSSGTSYGHLRAFLDGTQAGSSVQFAATFVIAARTLGLPARLVAGFTPGQPVPGRRAGEQEYLVRSTDALAWAQVRFKDTGWLSYPTPAAQRPGTDAGPGLAPGDSSDRARHLADAEAVHVVPPPVPPWPGPHGPGPGGLAVPWPWIALAVVVAGLAALAAAASAPPLRRHRRRRALDPRARALGAWQDVLQELWAAGATLSPATTTTGAVHACVALAGPPAEYSMAPLAELVATALFSAGGITLVAADRAWQYADALRPLLRGRRRRPAATRWRAVAMAGGRRPAATGAGTPAGTAVRGRRRPIPPA